MVQKHIAIFASGEGSNAVNIIEYFKKKNLPATFFVLSDRKAAPVLEKARNLGVKAFSFQPKDFYESDFILEFLVENKIDLVVLAGFLKLVPENIIRQFPKKIINIHPALLPKYGGKGMYGANVHQAVFANKEAETGITIHEVDENFDQGRIVFQKSIALQPGDTPDMIRQKVHVLELRYFPEIVESKFNAI